MGDLAATLRLMVPELLAANGYPDVAEVAHELPARKFFVARRNAA